MTLPITPLNRPLDATVRVPGSKSITNRALVLAALTGGCQLTGALDCDDTRVMVDSLQKLEFDVTAHWVRETIRVARPETNHCIPTGHAELFVGNSGTSMRFLTAMVALGHGVYRLDGVARMRQRPIRDLCEAIAGFGVNMADVDGCPPVTVTSNGLKGGKVSIRGDLSSQFLSGLLMAAPFARSRVEIAVDGVLVSIPYVEMTLAMMRQFGLAVTNDNYRRFVIDAPQQGGRSEYAIEPDASAASYFLGAAAILGGQVTVAGLPTNSLQGDVRFADVLGQMGCRVERTDTGITVGGGPLHGIDVDMNDISDTVMTLGAVACFAEGPTNIRNVAHIRHKETDRLAALACELRKVGATVEERDDGLTITPGPLHGASIATYDDHRMAMSLALVGLRVRGILIENPSCVAKTYPKFFEDLAQL